MLGYFKLWNFEKQMCCLFLKIKIETDRNWRLELLQWGEENPGRCWPKQVIVLWHTMPTILWDHNIH